MKYLLVIATFLVFGTFFSSQVQAQTRTGVINTKQVTQRARIAEGVQSGELTQREAAVLKAQQRSIARTKKCAKADGIVTKAERRQINRQQRRASRNITVQKNDAQNRY